MDDIASAVELPANVADVATEDAATNTVAAERATASRWMPTLSRAAGDERDRRGVTWMRISDAVAAGSGRVAGRGLDLESAVARRVRTVPRTTRRIISDRSHRLPPLSAFGAPRRRDALRRDGVDRS